MDTPQFTILISSFFSDLQNTAPALGFILLWGPQGFSVLFNLINGFKLCIYIVLSNSHFYSINQMTGNKAA